MMHPPVQRFAIATDLKSVQNIGHRRRARNNVCFSLVRGDAPSQLTSSIAQGFTAVLNEMTGDCVDLCSAKRASSRSARGACPLSVGPKQRFARA